ncbi:MAG TPA: PAS domain-containing protein [Candidatus Hydrogenedentes bacterium]|nr:PAS domain-containing protein [Candidatus Hydrogenedentota bacterium]
MKNNKERIAVSQPYEAILESISDGVFTVDNEWRITTFNRAAEAITGIPREEALGKRCSDVFRASMCETDCALRHTMETGKPLVNRACYIIDAEGNRIPISVSTALLRDKSGKVAGGAETFRDLSVVEELRKELEGRFEMGDIVSRSAKMRRLFDILPQVAASESTVLIQGETGTGKELLARAIHHLSRRCDKPFVAVNCAALPDTLLESELFGYQAGAFTGAEKDKPGRFALAEGGTLFLDEIGDISPALQVRLLRVLQERAYEPLGATKSVTANARVITATNKNLGEMAKTGAFRSDLFYRINVVQMELPPLRERKEDIPLLVDRFINRLNCIQDRAIEDVTPETMAVLMAHDYPGNVRELENIIEHAFVLSSSQGTIDIASLPEHLGARTANGAPHAAPLNAVVHNTEKQVILDALRRNNGNRLAAARELGIHKSTLFRKIKQLGIAAK